MFLSRNFLLFSVWVCSLNCSFLCIVIKSLPLIILVSPFCSATQKATYIFATFHGDYLSPCLLVSFLLFLWPQCNWITLVNFILFFPESDSLTLSPNSPPLHPHIFFIFLLFFYFSFNICTFQYIINDSFHYFSPFIFFLPFYKSLTSNVSMHSFSLYLYNDFHITLLPTAFFTHTYKYLWGPLSAST